MLMSLFVAGSRPGVADPPVPTVTFNAVGDFGQSTRTSAVLDAIGAVGDDFTLALGDLSYGDPGGEQAWCDYVKSRVGQSYPFELIVGNHDQGSDGNINDFSACLPNQLPGVVGTYGRQWYVDYPAVNPLVRVLMIAPGMTFSDGTTYDFSAGSPRYQWTSDAIDAARTAGIPWVVVGMHYPCLSAGTYGCSTPGPGADVINLLLAKKVDLVLTGHEHLYQRSKQISLGTGCATLTIGTYNAACVADADSTLSKGAGTVFVTSGLGGIERRDINLADPELGYFAAWRGANTNAGDGFIRFSATPDGLTGTFHSTSGQFSDSFTIGPAPANQPPTAAATGSCSGLSCTFSGTGSTDPDGSITAYAWTFGDGTTGTGATPAHTYATAGTYQVGLTVTDNSGAASAPTSISVTATGGQPPTALATDTFTRALAAGWGTANSGGTWSVSSTSVFSVSGDVGRIGMNPGQGGTATLPAGNPTAADLRFTLSASALPSGGSGVYTSAIVRRVAGQGDYRVKVRILANGATTVALVRTNAAGAETYLVAERTLGITYVPGTALSVRVQVTGSGSSTVQAKVWPSTSAEPGTWLVWATDATAGLQAPGSIGFVTYLSGATAARVVLGIDDLSVTAP